jgi:hypothetical protein
MTERDKELAEQADKFAKENSAQNIAAPGNNYFELFHEKFADLIRADEREACAKLARKVANATRPDDFALDKCYEIEIAIRARGNT